MVRALQALKSPSGLSLHHLLRSGSLWQERAKALQFAGTSGKDPSVSAVERERSVPVGLAGFEKMTITNPPTLISEEQRA